MCRRHRSSAASDSYKRQVRVAGAEAQSAQGIGRQVVAAMTGIGAGEAVRGYGGDDEAGMPGFQRLVV